MISAKIFSSLPCLPLSCARCIRAPQQRAFWMPLSVHTGPAEKDTVGSWTRRRSFQCSLCFYLSPSPLLVPNNRSLLTKSPGSTWKTVGVVYWHAQCSWWNRVPWCFWGEAKMLNTLQFMGSPDKGELVHARCHYGSPGEKYATTVFPPSIPSLAVNTPSKMTPGCTLFMLCISQFQTQLPQSPCSGQNIMILA